MTNSTTAETPRPRTVLRWLLAIVGAGAALLLLAGWSLWHWADRRTESQFQRLRDAGGPASLAEFHALHSPPSRETVAANLWLQAAIVLNAADSPELFQQWMPPEGGPAPSIPSVESRQRRALELMHRAAGIDAERSARYAPHAAVHYPLRSSADAGLDFPHLAGLRQCLQLLRTELSGQLRDQDAAGAAMTLHCMLRLGRSLEHERTIPGMLLRCGIDDRTCQELLLAMRELYFTDDDLRGWQAELRAIDPQAAFQAALAGDRLREGLPLIDPLADDPNFQPDLTWRLLRGSELQYYFDQVEQMMDAANRSYVEGEQIEAEIRDRLPLLAGPQALRPGQAAAIRLFPQFSASREAVARWTAGARATEAAIAAELHRRQHGAFPQRLDQLVPSWLNSVPRDPFDAQPLRYRGGETDCVLYSIGGNRRDDGGTLHDLRQGDLLYKLRVPPNAPPANGPPP
jgi:hypothetical protein